MDIEKFRNKTIILMISTYEEEDDLVVYRGEITVHQGMVLGCWVPTGVIRLEGELLEDIIPMPPALKPSLFNFDLLLPATKNPTHKEHKQMKKTLKKWNEMKEPLSVIKKFAPKELMN